MNRGRDMKNLVVRNGIYHFRGYVPKELILAGYARERHSSLKTTDYTEAINKRDLARVAHREWVEISRRQHHRKFLVLDELSDDNILDLTREVYQYYWRDAQERRNEYAQRLGHDLDSEITGYEDMLARLKKGSILGNDIDGIADDAAKEILSVRMIDISKSPESYLKLRRKILEAMVQVQTDLIDLVKGEVGRNASPVYVNIDTGQPKDVVNKPDGRTGDDGKSALALGPLVSEFLEEVRLRRRDKGYQAMDASMRLMAEFFGRDMNVSGIRRRECNSFRSFVKKLPSNYRKRYPGVDVNNIPDIRKLEHELMSYANINKILNQMIQFLRWLEDMELIIRAPSSRNLTLRDPVPDKEKRNPFPTEQLIQVFSSERMVLEAKQQSMFFWAYVIGLYQGFRLDEISRLDSENIQKHDGTYFFEIKIPDEIINGNIPGRSKTVARIVPMNPVLMELGLPVFARNRPESSKLFEEARRGAGGYYSRGVSDQTRDFMDSLGIPIGGPTFHSFRHNFRDAMTDADLSQAVSSYLGGWSLGGVMNNVYGTTKLSPKAIEAVGEIAFPGVDEVILRLKPSALS